MAMLRGIETLALGRRETVQVFYDHGRYLDRAGEPVALDDHTCHSCLNMHFGLAADPIDFCPHCGQRASPWQDVSAALQWAQAYDFHWLHALGVRPFAVRRPDGLWVLAMAQDESMLQITGRFVDIRPL